MLENKSVNNLNNEIDKIAFLYEEFMKYKKQSKKMHWKVLFNCCEKFINFITLGLKNGQKINEAPSFYYLADELLITDNIINNKNYTKLLAKLKYIYNEIKNEKFLPLIKNTIIIKDINEFIQAEKIKTIDCIKRIIAKKNNKNDYYQNYTEFTNDLRKVLMKPKTNPLIICYFYEICKKLLNNIPLLLKEQKLNKVSFDELYNLCWTYLKSYKIIYENNSSFNLNKNQELFYYLNLNQVNKHIITDFK